MSTLKQKDAHRFLQQAGGDIEQAAKLANVPVSDIQYWTEKQPPEPQPKMAVTHGAFLDDDPDQCWESLRDGDDD